MIKTTERLLKIKSADRLESLGIIEVLVTYNDKSTKLFSLPNWILFRKGIIENLHEKGLCEIDFVEA